jgi:hypothetical protein
LFLFPLEEEKKEEEEESNLLLVVVAVVILFFDVVTTPVSSTVADVRIDIVRNEDSDARVRTEEVTEDDDEEAKFRRSFSTSSPRGIRRRILCEDDKSFDAPLKLTDAAFLRIFFDAPVFCTRQALVCADLDDVGQDEDMICFFDTQILWLGFVGRFTLSLFALRQLLLLLLSVSDLSAHLKEEGEGVAQQQEEMRMRRGIRFSQFMLLNEELICAGVVS